VNALAAALATLSLPATLEDNLNNYRQLFLKWNRRINLSAARTDEDVDEHIVDSLHAVPPLRSLQLRSSPPSLRVLDVGAGGGFPSVVIAICVPNAVITALEPVHKKHAFLRACARELALANFDPRPERLEDHIASDYDAAMSRATFDLREWLATGLSRIRPGGLVLGFEAALRSDLPHEAQRYSYLLNTKPRSIVTLHRPLWNPIIP
jgi:16S rRNA (guanine527-N7)-methyltransferase